MPSFTKTAEDPKKRTKNLTIKFPKPLSVPVVRNSRAIHFGQLISAITHILDNLKWAFPLGHKFRQVLLVDHLPKDKINHVKRLDPDVLVITPGQLLLIGSILNVGIVPEVVNAICLGG